MKYVRKNLLKQAEMQENELQIVSREMGSRKMTMQSKKQIKNQSQAGYMQSNEPQIAGEEAGKRNRIKTHSQSGRSMIEMLGVLAIIAILSIGGIVGFRLAMNYYQANQIAHEMNMMRTDAQIKIAQGAEELMLGEPYDPVSDSQLGHIQFNDAYLVDFDCIYMKTEISEPEPAFCTAANAYYIELQEIPEGVCRPLANLIDNMDNEIAFYINGNSVDAEEGEKGACGEGSNTLKVIFGADSDSNAVKCNDDPECPENLPICFNHMCVECTQEKGCEGKSQYCKDNTCKTCESGVWNGEECVECTTSADCENPTPICNENTCVACGNDDECRSKNSSEENCVTGGACCKDPRMTWKNNECVCPEDEPWNGESCGCKSNDDCETNEYCHIVWRVLDESGNITYMKDNGACGKGDTGICRSLGNYQSQDLGDDTYYISDINMVWWSAENYCQALGKIGKGSGRMVSWSKLDLNCDNDIILEDGCKCGENGCTGGDCGSVIYKSGDGVYCLKDASLPQSQTNIPNKIIKIRDLFFNGQSKHVWLADVSSCFAKTFRTDGYIYMRARYFGYGSKSTDGYALCY